MSIIQTLIANTDDQCRYLTPGVIGVCQMYNPLGTPIEAVGESIQAMKPIAIALLSAEDVGEVGGYFDYLIQRVSEKS